MAPRVKSAAGIHRILIRRLLISATAISAVMGIVTYAAVSRSANDIVLDHVYESANRFTDAVARQQSSSVPLSVTDLEASLASIEEALSGPQTCRCVAFRVVTKTGDPIVEWTGALTDTEGREPYLFLPAEVDPAPRHQAIRINGRSYVQVSIPITNNAGRPAAWGQGLFLLSDRVQDHLRRRTVRTVAIVIGIVFVTSALLYPAVLTLVQRLTCMAMDLLASHMDTLRVLGGAIAKRDSDTDAHNYRVTVMAVRIAEAMGLSAQEIRSLIKGAFLHDVGKIGIPDHILLKPGALNDAEYRVMQSHVDKGLDIIRRSRWLTDAENVVGSHHEKMDGSGYPNGLVGSETPVAARIFAAADVFDALTSRRPYKEALNLETAMAIIREGRGSHFDPDVLDCFEAVAPGLFEAYSDQSETRLRQELEQISEAYFRQDVNSMIECLRCD